MSEVIFYCQILHVKLKKFQRQNFSAKDNSHLKHQNDHLYSIMQKTGDTKILLLLLYMVRPECLG